MENNLHQQKVAILSRLIKESSLTLEEALVLLKEEEEKVVDGPVEPIVQYPTSYPTYTPGQVFRHYFPPDSSMTITTSGNVGIGTTTTTNTATLTMPSPDSADLNN